jgi:glycosyltransferase involved in cell wall biosynthesis
MKILISTFSFPPNKDGVAEAASMMASGFLERGWEVEVATSTTTPPSSELVWHGARIHQFSITGTGHPKLPFRGNVSDYRAFLESGDWDIVVFHAYAWTLYLALGNLAKIRGRIILVSHGHNVLRWIRVAKFPWGLGSVFWAIYQTTRMCGWIFQFDRVVYLSKYADMSAFFDHSIAKRLGYRGRRVIPNGVNLEERATAPLKFRRDFDIGPEQIVFLCVSNYNYLKNQGFALRSFRMAAIPNSVMIFIGSEFNELSKQFQDEDEIAGGTDHPGRVIWLEKQDRETTLNAIAACEVFILSSKSEAQPIALLEAMREAKPWIACKVGCIPEMPGGICVHTEEEMAKQMVHLANDQNLRTTLGKRGRQAVEETYNRKHYVDSYCDLISEITGTRKE